jgi:prolipoprotein diacylglyceryltransferase
MNRKKISKNIIIGTSMIGYGLFNFIIEFIRQEPLVFGGPFTMGQIFEFLIILLGFYTIFKIKDSQIEG